MERRAPGFGEPGIGASHAFGATLIPPASLTSLQWLARSAAALLALSALSVAARPSTYLCGEDLEVKVDFTPRKAQLHLREKNYTLQRVKSAHDGHYVNSKEGLDLLANKGDLQLREGKNQLQCKLQITP